jgi:hypothetical protein
LIAQKAEGEKRSFIEEMTGRAKSLGVSITDLFVKSELKPPKKAAPKKRAGVRASPPIKFSWSKEFMGDVRFRQFAKCMIQGGF